MIVEAVQNYYDKLNNNVLLFEKGKKYICEQDNNDHFIYLIDNKELIREIKYFFITEFDKYFVIVDKSFIYKIKPDNIKLLCYKK